MRRVTMRAGSLLLWNQCTVHGAVPNSSARPRVAQFIRGFRSGELSPHRAIARANALRQAMKKTGALDNLLPLASKVFGFEAAEEAEIAITVEKHCAYPLRHDNETSATQSSPTISGDYQTSTLGNDHTSNKESVSGDELQDMAIAYYEKKWTGSTKRQLSAEDAARYEFGSLLDLVPNDTRHFLLPANPESEGRISMSYLQLHRLAEELFKSPELARLPRGSRIAASLPSYCPELAACFLALTAGGRFEFAPLDPNLTENDFLFALSDLPASLLIVESYRNGRTRGKLASAAGIPVIVMVPDTKVFGMFSVMAINFQLENEEESKLDPDVERKCPTTSSLTEGLLDKAELRDAVALVMYTSGTTRRPKLVPLTHAQLGIGAICVVSTLQLDRSSMCINVMPLFHLHGLMVNILATAVAGAGVICAPRFDAALFFEWLLPVRPRQETSDRCTYEHGAPNWYSAVPTIHIEVLRFAEQFRENHGSSPPHSLDIIRNCSAALAPAIALRLEEALPGVAVLTSYAMTEALPICSNPHPTAGHRDHASVGKVAGPLVRIAKIEVNSSAGQTVTTTFLLPNEVGEVVVKGKCVFKGYEEREHLGCNPNTDAFVGGGWFRTGDCGWIDSSGYLHLTGRLKEIINRAGEKISPLTIEHTVVATAPDYCPGLRDVVAFAVPHDELGEVVGLAACSKNGVSVSLSELRRCCSKSRLIDRRWFPEILVHVTKLPLGPTGKPLRIGLAEKMGLPKLCFTDSMKTIDMRGSASRPKDYEASRRAEARKSSARRNRRDGNGAGGDAGHNTNLLEPSSITSLDGCVQVALVAMAEASGVKVSEDDNLFDAGLSSISATRLREALIRRTDLPLPDAIIYNHSTARSLGAAIFCMTVTIADGGLNYSNDIQLPLLTTKAVIEYHKGNLDGAKGLCILGLRRLGLPKEWWQQDNVTEASRMLLEIADGVDELVQLLLIIAWVWITTRQFREAIIAHRILILARLKRPIVKEIDTALLLMQLSVLYSQLGDTTTCLAVRSEARNTVGNIGAYSPESIKDEHLICKSKNCTSFPVGCVQRLILPETDRMKITKISCVHCLDLTVLVIRRQRLQVLPDCIADLRQLEILDATDNMITVLPDSICEIMSLSELVVPQNKLAELPQGLALIPRLSTLILRHNNFNRLPTVVLKCRQLKCLRWGYQSFESAMLKRAELSAATSSDGISYEVSDDQDHQEGSVPAELQILEMEGTNLNRFPDCSDATALTAVVASFNRFHQIPSHLNQCSKTLKILSLGSNKLGLLGAESLLPLGLLPHLTKLYLENNGLSELPTCIGNLKNLRELSVFGNNLTFLPIEIGSCSALEVLDAHHNKLTKVAESVRQLVRLKSLYLAANYLTDLKYLRHTVLRFGSPLYLSPLHKQYIIERKIKTTLTLILFACTRHLRSLQNLQLGANMFDVTDAFELPGVRVGLGWNCGNGKLPVSISCALTENFGITDHHYDPICVGHRGDILVVAFAGQGVGNLQWNTPCAAARAAGVALDALYLADPSNSYYMQSPDGCWNGIGHFGNIIAQYAPHYSKVLIVGSSMGGTAALLHAAGGGKVLAFGPKVNLEMTHGSFLPPSVRAACASAIHAALIKSAVINGNSAVEVHVGSENLEDVLQGQLVPGQCLRQHDTFHHNVRRKPYSCRFIFFFLILFNRRCQCGSNVKDYCFHYLRGH